MRKTFQFALGAAFLLVLSSGVQAQKSMGRVSSAHVSVARQATPPVMVRPGPRFTRAMPMGRPLPSPRRTVGRTSSRPPNVTVLNGSGLSVQDLLNSDPGFGFSFEHENALNQDLGIRALIDPETQLQLALAERLLRDSAFVPTVFPYFGGYPFADYGENAAPAAAEEPAAPQEPAQQAPPQIIILQQPAAPVSAPAATQPSESPAPSLPGEGQFVLVTRDGKQLNAVAFTRQGGRIVYVTPQGIRRSVALEDLDQDATERVNEEKGTSLQLPL
ncbi:MAG: hypothetical protein ACRD50_02965 [Candidatus Acidiferrales bacterium]